MQHGCAENPQAPVAVVQPAWQAVIGNVPGREARGADRHARSGVQLAERPHRPSRPPWRARRCPSQRWPGRTSRTPTVMDSFSPGRTTSCFEPRHAHRARDLCMPSRVDYRSASRRATISPVARGCSAVGSAQPCQGWGRGFESRHPLGVSSGIKPSGGVAEW